MADNDTKNTAEPQFTWLECLFFPLMILSYLVGWAIALAIVIEKLMYQQKSSPYLYLSCFLVGHLSAGLKNLHYTYRDSRRESTSKWTWFAMITLIPFSPLTRYVRALRFGAQEKERPECGKRFVEECLTAAILRLFDVLLCDAPIIVLLLTDDIWRKSDQWRNLIINGTADFVGCEPNCPEDIWQPNLRWVVARQLFLLSRIAQTLAFYTVIIKRLQHMQYPHLFSHLRTRGQRQGRLNIFATVLVFGTNNFFVGSRLLGWSLVLTALGPWVFLLIGVRWTFHIIWYLLSQINRTLITPVRSVSPILIGGIWLFFLTNEEGRQQLGRLLLYYSVAFSESLVCCYIFTLVTEETDYFYNKAPWIVGVFFLLSVIAHLLYYTLCHPGSPSFHRISATNCCSGNRREMLEEGGEEDEEEIRGECPSQEKQENLK